jgi:hypothetical protein
MMTDPTPASANKNGGLTRLERLLLSMPFLNKVRLAFSPKIEQC